MRKTNKQHINGADTGDEPHASKPRRAVTAIAGALFLLSLIPLVAIARYDHPCSDDYAYGLHTVFTWRETGSLPQTIAAAMQGVRQSYLTWQGSFTGVFIMTLQPAVFGEALYPLGAAAVILLHAASSLFLYWVVFRRCFGADRHTTILLGAVLTFLSMQFLPFPVEAYYWYNSAMYYTGFHAIACIFFALLLLSLKASRPFIQGLYAAAALLLGILIGGGNFVVALTALVVAGGMLAYRVICRRKGWAAFLSGFLGICTALLISVCAPGNAVRQELLAGLSPVTAILLSFVQPLLLAVYYTRVPVLLGFAMITPLLYRVARGAAFSFRLPGLVSAFLYCALASSFTPNLYAMASFGPPRVVNENCLLAQMFVLFAIFYWCGWIARRLPQRNENSAKKSRRHGESWAPAMAVLAGCFALSCLLVSDLDESAMATVSAARSMISGEASAYHEENLARVAVYRDPAIADAEVYPLWCEAVPAIPRRPPPDPRITQQ